MPMRWKVGKVMVWFATYVFVGFMVSTALWLKISDGDAVKGKSTKVKFTAIVILWVFWPIFLLYRIL